MTRTTTYVVAQLDDAKPAVKHDFFAAELMQRQRQMDSGRSAQLMMKWFNPDEISQRMQYKAEEKRARGGSRGPAPAPEEQAPPLF